MDSGFRGKILHIGAIIANFPYFCDGVGGMRRCLEMAILECSHNVKILKIGISPIS